MRIGEIAVVGTGKEEKKSFIKSVCEEIVVETDSLIFGTLPINSELIVHLYGLDFLEQEFSPTWDLVAKKLLGYVVLFNWDSPDAYAKLKSGIDSLTARYRIPLVVAAVLQNGQSPIPNELLNVDFNLADQEQFTFCNIAKPESVKQVLVILINSIIQKYN